MERDVTQDASALDGLRELGILTTPVTVIEGEVVIGFDQDRLATLLGDS
ncbi:MAG: glutaredoxin family protein [Promethearchaeota archaeon]